MRKLGLLVVFVTLVALSPKTVKACTCVTSSETIKGFSLKTWLKEFDGAMFTGRVKKIETVRLKVDQELASDSLRVTFQVDKYWKGVNNTEAVVYTGAGCCDCGVHYVEGENYFVIAHRIDGYLRTNICTSHENYRDVDLYIKELGRGKTPKAQKR